MKLRRLSEGERQGVSGSFAGEMEGDGLSPVEDLQHDLDWAQRILDDRTLVPVQQKKSQEKPHSALHLIWGIILVLIVIFVRRLPRFPGVVRPDRVNLGDPLMYWEVKSLIGDNPEEGMQLRLRNNPQTVKGFVDFALLSRESLDRREKSRQRIYKFQREIVDAFDPILRITDRMASTVRQLPPIAESLPENAEELRDQLRHLYDAEVSASDQKDEFIDRWSVNRMRKELYPDPRVASALRRLIEIDSTHMHKKMMMLEFLSGEAMKATEGATISPGVRRELLALDARFKAAATEAERETAACMELLPPQDHWILLLFVDRLPHTTLPSPLAASLN